MKLQWSLISALIIALLTAIFAVINVKAVQVNLLFQVVEIPLILLIVGCTLLGGLIVFSLGMFRQFKLQREVKRLKRQLELLQQEPAAQNAAGGTKEAVAAEASPVENTDPLAK
ncbi:lipopolysaccharide assembly protein LapA domain-containing protein [Paenibacillus sp. P96]|uniref:Lipopolysaccharide assembly protein LapA domain-containing protein n=1 Tax=Paenibacillus zeirhizosphaerae TaxID=2987519 RepID=A0ABT9FTC5_9BACL|nr:lipopolysaccharide assembly protein LapA domain-containing protein [Paenibacillus sp. P96]MDP4097751.1 lipopolysaccharide assembly protein LapA domain-containing protein [Paenibacillus sp. P96]